MPIVEGLVIPVYLGTESPGTLWIIAHDEECKFDAEDVRVMTSLAEFTAGSAAGAFALTSRNEKPRRSRAANRGTKNRLKKNCAAHMRIWNRWCKRAPRNCGNFLQD